MIPKSEKGYIGLEPLSKAILFCTAVTVAGMLFAACVVLLTKQEKADVASAIVFADNAVLFAKELLGATVVPTLICEILLLKSGCKKQKTGK